MYIPTAGGWNVDIPPGTVFYIGEVPGATPDEPRLRPAFNRVLPDTTADEPVRGVLTDEAYRCRRIDELVRRAAVTQGSS